MLPCDAISSSISECYALCPSLEHRFQALVKPRKIKTKKEKLPRSTLEETESTETKCKAIYGFVKFVFTLDKFLERVLITCLRAILGTLLHSMPGQ